MSLGTVESNVGNAQMYAPILACAFTFSGQTTPGLLLATTPITIPSGGIGILPAGFYDGRIAQQDIDAFQYKSSLGVDRPGKVSVHIWDADHYIWNNYVQSTSGTPQYGFRGATLQMALILWQPGTTNFSSDAPIMFSGTADQEVPNQGWEVLTISANTGHDTAVIKLPMFPIQNRCPLIFPATAAQRFSAAFDQTSPYYLCGYSYGVPGGSGNLGPPNHTNAYTGTVVTDSTGIYISCDYLRSDVSRTDETTGCMARLGNYATTSVAPDGDLWHDTSGNGTGRFAGVEWSPPGYYTIGRNYINNSNQADFSFQNQAVLGQYHNLLYGTQWVNPKIANVIESGNDTKCKAMICTGYSAIISNIPGSVTYGQITFGGVIQVVANGIQISRTGLLTVVQNYVQDQENNLWWDYVSLGDRGGIPGQHDTGYSTSSYSQLDDCYGSIYTIEIVMYSQIYTGYGVPSIQVLATGPAVLAFVPVATVSGNGTTMTITFADASGPAYAWEYFGLNFYAPPIVQVIGNSLAAANTVYTGLGPSNWTEGPPGIVTAPSSVSGLGTGGYAGTYSPFENSNPAWVVLDLMLKCNYAISELNLGSFCKSAVYCDTDISYINNLGKSASHARFICQFDLENRKSGSSVIAAVLKCFNGYLYYDQSGLLNLGISQTLADSQGSAVYGSNYNTAISSITAGGTSANGYAAYLFDTSNISTTGTGDSIRLDIQAEGNATILTPNQIYINFQDMDNQYVVDSLGEIDANAVLRAGGALQPNGALVPETLDILGISNMDQAVRIANMYLAERQYGNLANDPRGTQIYTFTTSIRAETLRTGHLVLLNLPEFGYSMQLFRVLKIVPTTNMQQLRITIQFHNDVWYTDAYGQQPQAFYSTAGILPRSHAPLPWQPYALQPQSPSSSLVLTQVAVGSGNAVYSYSSYTGFAPFVGMTVSVTGFTNAGNNVTVVLTAASGGSSGTITAVASSQVNETHSATGVENPAFNPTSWTFNLAEIDGLQTNGAPAVSLQVAGCLPVNQPSGLCQPPIVPVQNTSTTTGTISPGNYLVQICSLDSSGNYSGPSGFISCTLTSVGGFVIGNIGWLSGAVGYAVFVGTTHYNLTEQVVVSSGTPSSITISSLPNRKTYAPPDLTAAYIGLQAKEVLHGGIIGEVVIVNGLNASPPTVTIGGPASGTLASMAGRTLMLVCRPNLEANLPLITFTIVSNGGTSGVTLTVDRDPTSTGTSPLQAGDVVVICSQATTYSSTTIGDSGIVNVYYPTGLSGIEVGFIVRIIAGTGAGQYRTITAVSGSPYPYIYTVTPAWNTTPDATSIFIVEEPSWRWSSNVLTPINASTYTSAPAGTLEVSNYTDQAILIQAVTFDASKTYESNSFKSPVRMIWVNGSQGTTGVIST